MITISGFATPKIERDRVARNYGKYSIGPLEAGYGITLGNALRRVLLSSLDGAAITSVRISDTYHEFTAVPGMREDMLQVMLHLRELRLKLLEGAVARLYLKVRGEGTVTAADIICPPEVEIINPELYLFTMDGERAKFDMELSAQRGRGFSVGEERGRLPIGELPVDAVFSPVRKVNWDVESARHGQNIGFDKLVMEIWTDGTISPEDAMSGSAAILMHHLREISGVTEEMMAGVETDEATAVKGVGELYERSIDTLQLSVRVFNALKRSGIHTVGELVDYVKKSPDAMLSIRNFGEKSRDELREKLVLEGLVDAEFFQAETPEQETPS